MRTEGAGQVAFLLALATLVSLLLVAALSAEAKNTNVSREEPSAPLFSVLGRHLSSVLTQSDTPDLEVVSEKLHHRGGGHSPAGRADNSSVWWLPSSPTRHRHHHGRGRPHRWHHNSTAGGGGHEVCYGPNEVLIVIAVTCAVNFAFIFGIMTVVHFCNIRNHAHIHSAASLSKLVSAGHPDSLTLVADGRCPVKARRRSCEPCSSASMTMLLLPELEAEEEAPADSTTWYPGPGNVNYQALSQAHSMEDLHILE